MEIHEVVRLLRTGASDRDIVKLVGLNRRTVAKYRAWAEEQGVLAGPLPSSGELERRLAATLPVARPPQQVSSVARYQEEIAAYRARGVEASAIRARLEEAHGHPVSYSAIWRLVRRLAPPDPEVVVRVEVPPGSEAQVDFGYAGWQIDPATGERRKSWVFTMVLSWSRHQYAEVVFDQRVETWLLCHRHAFEFWGGVPSRVVLDNLKAAILHASVTEPQAQRAYRECAQHYGFLIDPNPPRSPHLKGKVEQGGVHYVCRNFLAGRDPTPLDALNRKLLIWCGAVAGQRTHGTTRERPLERFTRVERAALRPLPAVPYDLAIWKTVTLYRDCYVVFEHAYYSAPYRLVGQPLWVRGGARTVEIYTAQHELVATHDRATAPGERTTILAHLPPHKLRGLVASREVCRAQAVSIGLATVAVVELQLAHRPEDRLKVAQRLLGFAAAVGPGRLERACARALHYGTPDYPSIKRILTAGLDHASLEPPPAPGLRRLT
ncbi:MAG: IS21 family transposase, partial [Gemmatimonadales bacterium]